MVVLYYWASGLWSREHKAAEWLFILGIRVVVT